LSAGLPLLVLHDFGDPAAGGPWVSALQESGWPGAVHGPELPGHGSSPGLPGNYESSDIALSALRALADQQWERPVVLGVGASGWPAQVLALGGRAAAVVLVDGLGGPWADAEEVIDAGRRWLRAIADDPEAHAPPVPGRPDPRVRHGISAQRSRALAERAAAAMPVPALLVVTGASPLPEAEAGRLASLFPSGAVLARATDPSPGSVAGLVAEWGRALASQA